MALSSQLVRAKSRGCWNVDITQSNLVHCLLATAVLNQLSHFLNAMEIYHCMSRLTRIVAGTNCLLHRNLWGSFRQTTQTLRWFLDVHRILIIRWRRRKTCSSILMDRLSTASYSPKQHQIPADAKDHDKLFKLKSYDANQLPKKIISETKHSVKYLPFILSIISAPQISTLHAPRPSVTSPHITWYSLSNQVTAKHQPWLLRLYSKPPIYALPPYWPVK